MKRNKIYIILLCALSAVSLASCLDKETNNLRIDRTDGRFVSLRFAKNDSVPGLERAAFSLEYDELLDDTVIVNLDSLPHLTRVDSVLATFSFVTTSGSYIIQTLSGGMKDTIFLTGNDTIDFTWPTTVYNHSADGSKIFDYPVKVNVHRVEPELYVWKRLHTGISLRPEINQKAIRFGNRFLYYTGSDTETRLYAADCHAEGQLLTEATVWSDLGVVEAGNASSLKLRCMTEHAGRLYVTDNDGRLYRSADGKTWEAVGVTAEAGSYIYNLLFSVDGSLWGITATGQDDFRLGSTTDGTHWQDKGVLPRDWQDGERRFPIDDYASLVFKSAVGRPKMMVAGGLNAAGQFNNTTWVSQDAVTWVPLREVALPALQDAALTQYDGKLFLFGGMRSSGVIVPMMESLNEGLSWHEPDSAYNVLPEMLAPRAYQSVILDEADKRLYFIGGNDGVGHAYADVWTAKLNRMFFNEE